MLRGQTKFTVSSKSRTGIVYIPADLVKDSSFPFKPEDIVIVRIDNGKIIIEGA